MYYTMTSLPNKIIALAANAAEGTPIYAKELLHLGSRASVDQALSRLNRAERLIRIRRGTYILPKKTRFGMLPPAPEKTVEAISKARGETIVPSCAAAANTLGITAQVPVRTTYLTSGSTRRLSFGNQIIELQHAPAWQLLLPNSRAGTMIRALAWLGKETGDHSKRLREKLTPNEAKEALAVRNQLPTWLAEEVSELAKITPSI